MSRTTIYRHTSGETTPSMRDRKLYAHAFHIAPDEFERMWRASAVQLSQGDPDKGIPVINRAPAGEVIDYEEYGPDSGIGYDYIKRYDIAEADAFSLQVVGDSMAPTLSEGDVVVFRPLDRSQPINEQIADGSLVFVRFTPESSREGCMLARLYVEGDEVVFRKDNPAHPPTRVKGEDVSQVAVAIEFRRKIRQPSL